MSFAEMIKLETVDVANRYTSLVDTVLSCHCAYKCVRVCVFVEQWQEECVEVTLTLPLQSKSVS